MILESFLRERGALELASSILLTNKISHITSSSTIHCWSFLMLDIASLFSYILLN